MREILKHILHKKLFVDTNPFYHITILEILIEEKKEIRFYYSLSTVPEKCAEKWYMDFIAIIQMDEIREYKINQILNFDQRSILSTKHCISQ